MKRQYGFSARSTYSIWGLLVVVFIAFAACDTTNVATDSGTDALDAPTAAIIEGLDLSNEQAERVMEITGRYDDGEPGQLWYIAAELQQTLTGDQIAELLDRNDTKATMGPRMRDKRGSRPRMQGGDFLENLSSPLTDEQRARLEVLREQHHTAMKGLMEQRRSGAISADEMKTRAQSLREAMRESLASILTEEQLQELKAHREAMQEKMQRRGAAGPEGRGFREGERQRPNAEGRGERRDMQKDAMIDALELTAQQQEQLQQLQEEHRARFEALREEMRNSEGDREAIKEAAEAMRNELEEEMAALFTEEQQEIIAMHRALMSELRSSRRTNRGTRNAGTFRQ